jgi:hypothetical protein
MGTDDAAPGHAASRDERSKEDLLGDPDGDIVAVEEISPAKNSPRIILGHKIVCFLYNRLSRDIISRISINISTQIITPNHRKMQIG